MILFQNISFNCREAIIVNFLGFALLLFAISCNKTNVDEKITYPSEITEPFDSTSSVINLLSLKEGKIHFLDTNEINIFSSIFSSNSAWYPISADLEKKATLKVKITSESKIHFTEAHRKGWLNSGITNNGNVTFLSSETEEHVLFLSFYKYPYGEKHKAIIEIFENGDDLTKSINISW